MIRVSVFSDGKQLAEYQQEEGKELSIGRSPGCVVRLPDPAISRLHATALYTKGGWVLERKSAYGQLSVNGQEIENAVLQGGEEIVIANFVLRVNISDVKTGTSSIKLSTSPDIKIPAPELESAQEKNERPSEISYKSSESSRTNIVRNLAVGFLRFEPGAANVSEFILNEDLVLIGRGSSCDVILHEKKASRKHLEIRRQGLSFYLKDLGSANSTFVNEKKVESVELIPGDIIRVGDSKFEFSIENKEFFAKQNQFMPIPIAALPEGGIVENALSGQTKSDILKVDVADDLGISAPGAKNSTDDIANEKSLFKKRWKQFQRLPRVYRLLIIFVAFLISISMFNSEEDPKKAKRAPVRAVDGSIIRRYEDLSDKNKKIVRDAYQEVLKAREEKNYTRMLDEIVKILRYVTEYRDAKLYEAEAKRGIEEEERRLEEEKHRKFQDELAQEVAKIVAKGQKLFEEALESESKRDDLNILIQEIYSKDPNNTTAQSWQAKIKAKIIDEARKRELDEQEKKLKDKAEQEFSKLEDLFQKEKYVDALAFADTLPNIGYSKENYLERVDEKKKEIHAKLASIVDPLLASADKERQPGGDLVKSKEYYMKALDVEPENQKALEGLESIRAVLHLRAKRLFAQAILAESVSSLDEAKQMLQKCLLVAPDKDPYKKRCESKLGKYDAFTKEEP